MEIEFDVKINSSILYDYMLHHTYTSAQGLIGTTVGALLVTAFFMGYGFIYLIFGSVLILYLPGSLWLKSKQQIQNNPAFQETLHYRLCEEGIEVSQHEVVQMAPWDSVRKAITTRSSFVVYTSRINAFIFPKRDMGQLTPKIMEAIATHISPDKNRMRA